MSWFDRSRFSELKHLLRRLRHPTQAEDELDEEVRTHYELLVERGMELGLSREAAQRAARVQFGGPEQVKEKVREARVGATIEALIHDIRHGIRPLLKQPGFTLITIVTLALGIGATTAVFALIQGVLLSPPPYTQPEKMVLIPAARADGQEMSGSRAWPASQWQDWQKQTKSFDGIAGYFWSFAFLIRSDGSESMEGMVVSPDYFKVTGLKPILGRAFLDSEGGPNSPQVIILGYDLWQRSFNGDRNVIGAQVRLSRRDAPSTVVGVMGPGVRFLPSPGVAQEPNYDVDAQVDYWTPVIPNPTGPAYKQPRWDVVGRLRPGVTVAQAQQELSLLTAQEATVDRDFEGFVPRLTPLAAAMNREGERILLPLLGAAGLVFLIACGNAAALLLVRGLQKQQEYAVRSALGVGRLTLVRQISLEGMWLALVGGALGAALAVGLVNLFKLVGGRAIPRLESVSIGWPVFFWGFGAAMVAALLAGLFPALRASYIDCVAVLKSAGPTSSAGRGERTLLRFVTIGQTALTLALLVGAGLLVRTMSNLAKVESGYETSRILTMSVTAVQGDWSAFHHLALQRVSAIPGVGGAAFAWGVPLTGNNWQGSVEIEGQPAPVKPSDRLIFPIRAVTPGYFTLLRLNLQNGRDFRDSDNREASAVAIVNQAFVERYFSGSRPIGRKLWMQGRQRPPAEIIGVIENSRTNDLTRAPEPEIYTSLWQNSAFSKHLVVRSAADPRSVMASIRSELRGVDATAAVENVKTLDEIRSDSQASRNFALQLLAGFSVIASVLTLVGIYGVLSLSVASRRRELAIRSAIGAAHTDIGKLVFGEGFRLIVAGIIAGIAAALLLSRFFQTFLYGVEPTDATTLITVGVLFAGVALPACWEPMRRAARVDPIEVLRYE